MMSKGIDFVVTWVDGSDQEWRKEKSKYLPKSNTDSGDNRYREWDNLKYWFRGVEKYAPWVRKVHFVTFGHLPKWLNVYCPKLHVVSHADYMNTEYLPTFSSRPIELNMHRIDGLSDNFVYFNDDMFIIKRVEERDFFRKGLPCASCGFEVINFNYERPFYDGLANNMRVINRNFNSSEFIKKNFWKIFNYHYGLKNNVKSLCLLPWSFGFIPGFINPHLPSAFQKSTFEELWEKEYDILDATSKHKFRSIDDVNPYVFQYWQYMQGKFIPINTNRLGKFYYMGKQYDACCQEIKSQKHKLICINDDLGKLDDEKYKLYKKGINSAFESILGEKSSFEI